MAKEELVKVEYIIPKSLEESIANKIDTAVRDAYFWNVTRAISGKVVEELAADGFTGRIAVAVLEKIKISENDFIEGVTEQVAIPFSLGHLSYPSLFSPLFVTLSSIISANLLVSFSILFKN